MYLHRIILASQYSTGGESVGGGRKAEEVVGEGRGVEGMRKQMEMWQKYKRSLTIKPAIFIPLSFFHHLLSIFQE